MYATEDPNRSTLPSFRALNTLVSLLKMPFKPFNEQLLSHLVESVAILLSSIDHLMLCYNARLIYHDLLDFRKSWKPIKSYALPLISVGATQRLVASLPLMTADNRTRNLNISTNSSRHLRESQMSSLICNRNVQHHPRSESVLRTRSK